ncbi:MAG: Cytochrome [Proteobacteria bacterium]|nr:Cytochrome [Pseudomonadota bacterium]
MLHDIAFLTTTNSAESSQIGLAVRVLRDDARRRPPAITATTTRPDMPDTAFSPPKAFSPAPGPRGHFLLGNLPDFRHRPLELMASWHATYGDIVRFRLGPRVFHMVNHPELAQRTLIDEPDTYVKMYRADKPMGLSLALGQGLVTSRGELWKRQRRTIQPMFHRSRITGMEGEIIAAGERMLRRWEDLEAGATLDIAEEMMRLALEIITRTMFSTSVLDEVDVLSPALKITLEYAAKSAQNPFLPPLWVPTSENRRFRRAKEVLDTLIQRLIRERRESDQRRGDLLDLLLEARDEATGEGMSDELIRDEALTIFAAGHETTAVALTWTWYLLGRHPEARARLRRELAEVLAGRTPSVGDLPQLRYTRAVFEESLRLYPPATGIMRAVARDAELAGHAVPGGSVIFVNICNIHRHPGFWAAADEFQPQRFLEEQEKPSHRLAFMPFGAGPRVCVGNHFALMEGTLLLAMIAQNFELELTRQAVERSLAVTQKPLGGLPIRLRKLRAGASLGESERPPSAVPAAG